MDKNKILKNVKSVDSFDPARKIIGNYNDEVQGQVRKVKDIKLSLKK